MAMTSSLDFSLVVPDEQQPVVQAIPTRDEVGLSGVLHSLQGTGPADAVLAGRGGEPDVPHPVIVSDTFGLIKRAMTAPTVLMTGRWYDVLIAAKAGRSIGRMSVRHRRRCPCTLGEDVVAREGWRLGDAPRSASIAGGAGRRGKFRR